MYVETTIQLTNLIKLKTRIAKKWKSDTPISSIFRNMVMLSTGEGLVKVISFITTPILTRIYLPEHFGVLSIFAALTAMIVPFGTLRYSMAIPLPKNDGLATNLAILSGIFLLIVSTLVFIFFWAFSPALLSLLSMKPLLPFWWLLPLAVAGTGLYELLTEWAVREKAFKPLAKTKVWQKVLGASFKIGLGLLGFKPLGLLIGQIFSQAGGIISLLKNFWIKLKSKLRQVTKKRMWFLFRRYADFPKYRLPSQFLLSFSTRAPLFFFAWHFGSETTGQLGLALMILALPMTLFGQTIGKAYYGEVAKIGKKNPEKIYSITKSITKKLFLISILPFLVLLFGGPWLFKIVFGEVWREAGVFVSILAVYLLPQFIYAPIGNGIFNVFEKQSKVLIINLSRMTLIILVFSLSHIISLEASLSLLLYSIVLGVYFIIVMMFIFMIIKKELKKI
jgi:O-antigen/teichoic acid export membrane protein